MVPKNTIVALQEVLEKNSQCFAMSNRRLQSSENLMARVEALLRHSLSLLERSAALGCIPAPTDPSDENILPAE